MYKSRHGSGDVCVIERESVCVYVHVCIFCVCTNVQTWMCMWYGACVCGFFFGACVYFHVYVHVCKHVDMDVSVLFSFLLFHNFYVKLYSKMLNFLLE